MNNQLQTRLLAAFPDAFISSYTHEDWSSISFSGGKHQICLAFKDAFKAAQCAFAVTHERVDVNLDDVGQLFAGTFLVDYDEEPLDGYYFVTMEAYTLND